MAKHIHWANPVDGNFTTAANWTGGAAPGSADDAYLDASTKTAFTVTASSSVTVNGIDTSAVATLAITAGTFTATNGTDGGVNAGKIAVGNGANFVFGGAFDNTGVIALGSTAQFTSLQIGAAGATLSGGGTVSLTDNAGNAIIAATSGGSQTLTNVDNTIAGAGYIGRNGASNLTLANQAKGVVDANGANALTLDASSGAFTNAGLIEATGAGGLILQNGTFANSGTVKATGPGALTLLGATLDDTAGGTFSPGASLILQNATVLGGTLTRAAGQTTTVNGFTVGNLATTTLTNAGAITALNGAVLIVQASVVNSGTISLASTGNVTTLEAAGATTTLSGGGTVSLSDNTQNQITGAAFGAQSLINIDNTIAGAGYIGRNGGNQLVFTNQAKGVVNASGAGALTLDASSGAFTNAGLIEATGAGGLILQNGTFANTGTVKATGAGALTLLGATLDDTAGGTFSPGASLILQNSTVLGGTLTRAAGQTTTVNGFTIGDLATTTLTNQSVITALNGAVLIVQASVVNSGTISLASTGNVTSLEVAGATTTLSGAGTIALSDKTQNQITGAAFGAQSLINIDNTIAGAGYIGRNGGNQLVFTNQAKGIVNASGTGALTLDASSGAFANAGLIEATGAGGLILQNGTFANSGKIKIVHASSLTLTSATLDDTGGGTLTPGATTVLQNGTILGGTLALTSSETVTVAGFTIGDLATTTLTNAGAITALNGAVLIVQASVVNSGTISLASTGNVTSFEVAGATTTLSGGGTVSLSDNTQNQITGAAFGAQTLINVDNTIAGAGYIGRNGGNQLVFTNQAKGIVNASGTSALTLDASSGAFTNAGLIEATGAGGLILQNGTFANSGTVKATGAGALTLLGATLDDTAGGTLSPGASLILQNSTVLGGTLTRAAGQTTTVNGFTVGNLATTTLTNAGAITALNGAVLIVQASVVNSGTISLASTGNVTTLEAAGATTTLSGGGTVSLSDNAQNQITGAAFGAQSLINVDNTIAGAGYIGRNGGNNLTLINQSQGVIDATSATNALILQTGTMTNAGVIEATGAGGLVIQSTTVNGAGGKILAKAGAVVNIQSSAVTGGALGTSAGGVINIDNGSSVTGDGTFANAGTIAVLSTGSRTSLDFDKSATLAGGGQIVLSANKRNTIAGTKSNVVLTNLDNTISGAGVIGKKLTLVNAAAGVIDANTSAGLTLNTGAVAIANAGLIEATAGGKGVVASAVNNTGMLATVGGALTFKAAVTGAGSASINGGTLDFISSFTENVAFTGKAGKLELGVSQTYAGQVSGFATTGKTSLDLDDIAFTGGQPGFSGTATSGVLTVTDGTHTAQITLEGNYLGATFAASSDGHGGTSIVATAPGARPPPAAPASHAFVAAMAGVHARPAAPIAAGAGWRGPSALLAAPHPHSAVA